jgi:hypothetical protein
VFPRVYRRTATADFSALLDANVETSSPDRISESPFLVAGQNDEWDTLCSDRAELRNGELPRRKNLKKHGFESVIDLIKLIDEQDAGSFALKCPHQRAWSKELSPRQIGLNRMPIRVLVL